jgi:hypothetical protein
MGKCRVLAPASLAIHVTALMAPLRAAGSEAWMVVPHLRVLGVMLADPAAGGHGLAPVRERLAVRVGDPLRRLVTDVEAGADRSAAFFLARRFVLPNLMFHMQAWGLHAPSELWSDVDAALDAFTAALAPADLRDRVASGSRLRREIALPQEMGGLGIPIAAAQAPVRAGEQWALADAEVTGALHVGAGYHRPPRAAGLAAPALAPLGIHGHAEKELVDLAAIAVGTDDDRGGCWAAHLHSRRLRGSLWCLDAPPSWDDRVALSDTDWDTQWRLNFGGVSEALRLRIDLPAERHGWRGKVMEHVVADAISACVPPGVLRTLMQPHTEKEPADHAERCHAEGTDPAAVRRADIAVDFRDARRLVIDVATTNVVSDSALSRSVPDSALSNIVLKHMEGIESTKDRRYKAYYRDFHPLVISLGGGVTERGWGVIKRICRTAAGLSQPRLEWEPYDWAVRALRHIAAGMARVMGWIATRIPVDAPDDCVVRVADGEQGRALALFRCGAGAAGSSEAQVGGTLMLPEAPGAGGSGG